MRKSRLTFWLLVLGSYFLLACLFFYPFFQGKVIFYVDNLLNIAPAYTFWKSEILSGRLPLWNPYIFAGLPFLADPSHPVFSPFNAFYLLVFNIFQAITFQAIFLVALAAGGAFYFADRVGLSPRNSWLAGLLYGFSGVMMENTGDVNSLVGLALTPWLLGLFYREIKQKRFFSWRLSLLTALFLISAHPQYLYYSLLPMGGIFLDFLIKNKQSLSLPKLMIGLVVTFGLALGLSACQTGPTLELTRFTNRSENFASLGEELSLSGIKPIKFVTAFFPKLFGSLVEGNSWGPGSLPEHGLASVGLFVSLSGLVLAGASVLLSSRYQRTARWIGLGVALVLLLALGDSSPIFRIAYSYIPGFSLFRSPTRILVLYSLGVALMAGFGLEAAGKTKKNWFRCRWWLIGAITFGFLVLGSLLYFKPDILVPVFSKAYFWLRQKPLEESLVYSLPKVAEISQILLKSGLLFLIGSLGVVSIVTWAVTRRFRWWVIAVFLLTAELFWGVRGSLLFTQPEALVINQKVVKSLRNQLGSERYITVSEIQPYSGIWIYLQHLVVRPPFSQEKVTDQELEDWLWLQKQIQQLPTNTNMLYGLKSSSGYVALLPQAYREFAQSNRVNQIYFQDYRNPVLNELATRFYLFDSQSEAEAKELDSLRHISSLPEVSIYENLAAKNRVEVIDDGDVQGEVKFIVDEPNRVSLETISSQSGQLILRDLWYPGWQVAVDGEEQTIERFDSIFRSVEVPAGKHEIVFTYRPLSIILGAGITLLASFGLGIALLWGRKR